VQRGSLKAIKFRGVKVWRAQWREQGKGRTKILGRCADVSRGDARAELDRIVAAVNNREVAKSPKVDTLRQYTENEYLLRQVGSRPLNQITRRELQVHLDSLAEEGRSASVVKHVRFQLQAIFAMAKGDGLITVDPTNGLVNPRCKRAPDKTVLNLADFARALMVLEIQERLIFQLALYEGMRPGEIVGLQMGDMAGDELRISRRIYAGKVDEPKSKRSWRPIPLTRQTGALLGQYLALTGETRSDAWLFPSETGNSPLDYSNVWRRRIGPELSKIGLAFVNFQVLRRTWATEFDPDGTNPHTRAALAGHSVDVSENVYRQTKPEDLRRAVNDWSGRLPLGSGLLQ
jgi:integrase